MPTPVELIRDVETDLAESIAETETNLARKLDGLERMRYRDAFYRGYAAGIDTCIKKVVPIKI